MLEINKYLNKQKEYALIDANIDAGGSVTVDAIKDADLVVLFYNQSTNNRGILHIYRLINNNAYLSVRGTDTTKTQNYIYGAIINFSTGVITNHASSDAPITRIMYK